VPEIQLTRGRVAIVDAEDAEALSAFSWSFNPSESTIGEGYAMSNLNGKTIYMHRLLLGARPGQEVDHANRNSLDNRRSNLRFATRSQQAVNVHYKPGISGYRGVQCDFDRTRPYRAKITIDGRTVRGMYRKTAEQAATDYDELARGAFGEFAILNFPDGTEVGISGLPGGRKANRRLESAERTALPASSDGVAG
jgi:hypothetical protein